MSKPGLPRKFRIYFVLFLLFAAVALLVPRTGQFKYDYKKGSPWTYETLVAQFDFPILKSKDQIEREREQARLNVIPYYRLSDEVVPRVLRAVEAVDLSDYPEAKNNVIDIVSSIYSRGVLDSVGISFGDNKVSVIYVQENRRSSKRALEEVFNVKEAKDELYVELTGLNSGYNIDSLCIATGLYDLLEPNLIYDAETTELIHNETSEEISETSGMMKEGYVIVNNGEMVTSDIYQVLESYKAEFYRIWGHNRSTLQLWAGNILMAFVLVFVFFLTVYFADWKIFGEFNKFLYLILIYFLTVLATILVENADGVDLMYVPFSLMALYMVTFFRKRLVFPVYAVSLLPLLIFAQGGMEKFVMFLVAGSVAILSFDRFTRGWQQFVTAFFVFISLFVTFALFRLIEGISGVRDFMPILYLAIGSLLTVLGYPLIYLFERLFGLMSKSRLQELSDTNNKMLRELASNAPGSFQHSLQVANMADSVARAIDADADLVRCGALYHDIGKINNPLCFIENDSTGNSVYHENCSPMESAKAIIAHVSDGIVLAEKANLPKVIQDFISTHHGSTCTAFFYNKFLQEGGDPSQRDSFCYAGPTPSSKEQCILMLCDSIEAASRTLKDVSAESISVFVENICNGKINEGQFNGADISMKEVVMVKAELKEFLRQFYHPRVKYPKNQENSVKN